ncbi:hypothetical protein [Amycolatopsis anabasis]|uniref:hypothetical protein n=1 Tax=Amycolatopsis anabasis TaxID=1840409 RepID=UPI00131EB168|nr:hypothetical protein [Amycolatopsis anabasis]
MTLQDLAWEVKERGKHMLLAADMMTSTEAEAAMKRHKESLHGSGYSPIDDAGKWLADNP